MRVKILYYTRFVQMNIYLFEEIDIIFSIERKVSFENEFFEQKYGLAMGNCLSPVCSNYASPSSRELWPRKQPPKPFLSMSAVRFKLALVGCQWRA